MNKKGKRRLAVLLGRLAAALCLELLWAGGRALLSLGSQPTFPAYLVGSGLTPREDGGYTLTAENGTLTLDDVPDTVRYLHLDAVCRSESGDVIPVAVTLSAVDDGHAEAYTLGKPTIYAAAPKSAYIRLHTYGRLHTLTIQFPSTAKEVVIRDLTLNARVPLFFSLSRFGVIFLLLCGIWLFRPASFIYRLPLLRSRTSAALILLVLLINAAFFAVLPRLNTFLIRPAWSHHYQYAQLAESLAKGRVDLDIAPNEALDQMENPYDTALRSKTAPGSPWDVAYYKGHYYVYFGIVPELLFYFPYYLLTGAAFPTWVGILLSALAALGGAFALMRQIVRRWFPDTSTGVFLLLSLILANGVGTIQMLLCPCFYCLPVLLAIALSLWGLSFWVHASAELADTVPSADRPRHAAVSFAAGSLCMALVAGCRPQFLIGSFFSLFLFGGYFLRRHPGYTRRKWGHLLCFAVPFILIAAGIMAYNYVRFGSVTDFGANYNLTTNDMTKRGFALARIPDGLLAYLFRLPNIDLIFPYVHAVPFTTEYIGVTVQENMYGGVLLTHLFVWVTAFSGCVRRELRQKRLWLPIWTSVAFALIVVILDAQMGGLLPRYPCDVQWLLLLSAAVTALALTARAETGTQKRRVITLFIIAGALLLCTEFFKGIANSHLEIYRPDSFLILKNWFL